MTMKNRSLFDDLPVTPAPLVPVARGALSKEQKAFAALIRKIESRRASLLQWREIETSFKRRYFSELHPLRERARELQIAFAQAMDQAHGSKGLTKTERRKLSVLITELAEQLLEEADEQALIALYDKHSGSNYAEEQAAELTEMKAMLEDVLGVDLDDDFDPAAPDAFIERLSREMQEQIRAEQEAKQARAAKRKQTAKSLAREAQRESDAQRMQQSIRDVYRGLAAVLHPDRETDDAERARKTEFMQQVNRAYADKDLLRLLELQMQFAQIDPDHISRLAPQRLNDYLKILRDQVRDLDREFEQEQLSFAMDFNLPPPGKRAMREVLMLLEVDITTCRSQIGVIEDQMSVTQDLARLKAWLKTVKLQRVKRPRYDDPFDWDDGPF